eukprot:gene13725-16699_t
MEKWMDDILPLMGCEHDCILSKQGDITIGFKTELPEIFTLSDQEYEGFHQAWIKAIKVLPKHSIFHKQDWFIERKYSAANHTERQKGFLEVSADRHFEGRKFLDHSCYIFLTKKPGGRKLSSSLFSNLIRSSIVPEQTINKNLLQEFEDTSSQFRQILEDSGFVKMTRLKDEDLYSQAKTMGVDMQFEKEGIKVGGQHCQLYTLSDVVDLPDLCGSRINYDKYSTDKTKFSIGFAGSMGLLLPCNHIYNQENAIARDATNDFLNETISQQRLPVKAHFNLITWNEDKEQLKAMRNMVTTAMSRIDAVAKLEVAGAPQIFWSGIPGNA